MKPALTLTGLVLLSSLGFSQDIQVREEAVRLLERANAVSSAPDLPNLERTDTLRVFGGDTIQEGTFTRVVIQGTGRRDDYSFGNFHLLNVFTRGQVAVVGTPQIAPPEINRLMRLTPIALVRFDHEDVIHSIVDREVGGRPARCIEFDTTAGARTQSNELCVDSVQGTLLSERLGRDFTENGDFFSFAGALFPGTIRYSEAGVLKMQVTQTMTALPDATPNVLAAPPDAQVRKACTTYRRAFGVSMPQPKPGNGGENTDIMVRGMIWGDGTVHDAIVQSSERPDLNPEALSLIQQWVFTPALCDGAPNRTEASFELHFQGR